MYPEIVSFQFPSWAPYLDWERAPDLPLVSDDIAAGSNWLKRADGSIRTFPATGGPVSVYDEQLRQEERADPVRFRVERRGQWANVTDPYLNGVWIDSMWEGPDGERLQRRDDGQLSVDYVIHLDPASKSDAFAVAIGHALDVGDRRYAVIDHVRRWEPNDDVLDLEAILDEIGILVRRFNPIQITVDQHGGEFVLASIRSRLGGHLPKHPSMWVRHHTAPLDIETTELFRDLMRVGLVRSYFDRQLDLELRYLQDRKGKISAPTTGPVTTDDDVADAVIVVATALLHPTTGLVHHDLATTQLHARPGLAPNDPVAQAFASISRRTQAQVPARPSTRRRPPPPRRRRPPR